MTWYLFPIAAVTSLLALAPAHAVDDGRGKDWRLLTETSLLSSRLTWEAVAAVCAVDGQTACNADIGSLRLKGWVWATAPQVRELLGAYAPALLGGATDSVGGFEYATPASTFLQNFGITAVYRGCPTYQPCWHLQYGTGMTASTVGTTAPAQAVGGQVVRDLEWGGGSFALFTPLHPDMPRGLWMWRPTGLGSGQVHANDDLATLARPGAGVAVPNVLANDWSAGVQATTGNVTLGVVSSSIAGLWLDTAQASVHVDSTVPVGSHQLVYRICNRTSPADCDDATVTVVVPSFAISAVADAGAVSMAAGGVAIANVLANDKLGGLPPTPQTVLLSQLSSSHPGLSLNAASGAVSVAAGTPHGGHALIYRICETASPTNCASATASVNPYAIDAVDDSARGSSKTGGVVIANVLANDRFNGLPATTAKVQISLPAALPAGIALNTGTGAVTVQPKTSSGIYSFAYRICEISSPANCDQATVKLDLSGKR